MRTLLKISSLESSFRMTISPALALAAVDVARLSAETYYTSDYDAFHLLAQTTERIWHDGLRDMYSIQPDKDTPSHLKFKQHALTMWQELGAVFDLKEDIDDVTLRIPSVPSSERRFWKIERRCFYNPCLCSLATPSDPQHTFQVCRGCYRVLYCNRQCQAL